MSSTPAVDFRTRLALTVGVSGHRRFETGVADELQQTFGRLLNGLAQALSEARDLHLIEHLDKPPILRIVSALAEGTDRIACHAMNGLAPPTQGQIETQLTVVLPFQADQYEQDFVASDGQRDELSVAEFRRLLSAAGDRVRVMGGFRDEGVRRGLAYEAAGRFILDNSDLMIVVHDPNRKHARGGTQQVKEESLRKGLPILLIDPNRPTEYRVLTARGGSKAGIRHLVSSILRLKAAQLQEDASPRHGPSSHGPETFERNLAGIYRLPWLLLMAASFCFRPHLIDSVRRAWKALGIRSKAFGHQSPPRGPLEERYARVQDVAMRYGALHRGAFLINYSLGAFAVASALLALADNERKAVWAVVEVVVLLLVLVNFWWSRRFRWLERFRDYRFLAEALRQVRVLQPLGMLPPTARPVIVESTGHPRNTWMDRCLRGWMREAGPVSGAHDVKSWLQDKARRWVEKQRDYHEDRAAKLEGAERFLQSLAYLCFALAFLGCAGHLVHYCVPDSPTGHWLEEHSIWLTLLAAGMPAFGAASHASAVQGEFARLIERSEEMIKELDKALLEVGELGKRDPAPLDEARHLAMRLAQLMLDEVTDWRIVHLGPEWLPG